MAVEGAAFAAGVNTTFSYALSASGGTGSYTWTQLGSWPSGVSLNSSGVISGSLATAGTYTVAARVTDSGGNSANANVTITITAPEEEAPSGGGTGAP